MATFQLKSAADTADILSVCSVLVVLAGAPPPDLLCKGVMEQQTQVQVNGAPQVVNDPAAIRARRTAFVARFIVLRESKRSRAHRIIEMMEWSDSTTAEELVIRFRQVFVDNGDNMTPVDRDLRRAFGHSQRSLNHFIQEYSSRSTKSFIEALYDYERSNTLLFGSEEQPKTGGWRLPKELEKVKQEKK